MLLSVLHSIMIYLEVFVTWAVSGVQSIANFLCTQQSSMKISQELVSAPISVPGVPKSLNTRFIGLYENVWLYFEGSVKHQDMNFSPVVGKSFFVDLKLPDKFENTSQFSPSALSEIFRFCDMMSAIERRHPLQNIVLCAGPSLKALQKSVFLIGCRLVMMLSLGDALRVYDEFRASASILLADASENGERELMLNGWAALHEAKCLGWVDFEDVFDIGSPRSRHIYIPEYLHYASPVNGALHIVVPGKFLAFPAPAQLPQRCPWRDSNGCRLFSADFYGELLLDFNTTQVVRIDPKVSEEDFDADADALVNWGLAVHNFHGELSLQHLDRFMTLAQSNSVVAIQYADQEGLSHAGTLMACWMVRQKRFATSDLALAWLRMLVPGASMSLRHDLLRVVSVATSPHNGADSPDRPPSPMRCVSLNEEAMRRRSGKSPPAPGPPATVLTDSRRGPPLARARYLLEAEAMTQLTTSAPAATNIQRERVVHSPVLRSARPRPRTGSLPTSSLLPVEAQTAAVMVGRGTFVLG